MPTPRPTKIETRLKRHLKAKQGHLGRSGEEIIRLARATGLSVHQLQSIAMRRRGVSAESQRLLEAVLP